MDREKATAPSPRMRVKRLPARGHYDAATINRILDAALLCHVGYVLDDQPYVTPTAHWREGKYVYWHGSSASRMLRAVKGGIPVCVTVSLLDGIVFARSGFHHSMNYRAVMAVGIAEPVEGTALLAALEHFPERLAPGRWRRVRAPTSQELKATTVLRLKLDEASAKIRTGPPVDDEEDYALPVWAGIVPLSLMAGAPIADAQLPANIPVPDEITNFSIERRSLQEKDRS